MKAEYIDSGVRLAALMVLSNTKSCLTQQQYKTLRGQVLSGDPDGAMKGLRRILQRRADRLKKA